METREPPPLFPPINFNLAHQSVLLTKKRSESSCATSKHYNFLWDRMPAAARKKREEGEEEKIHLKSKFLKRARRTQGKAKNVKTALKHWERQLFTCTTCLRRLLDPLNLLLYISVEFWLPSANSWWAIWSGQSDWTYTNQWALSSWLTACRAGRKLGIKTGTYITLAVYIFT